MLKKVIKHFVVDLTATQSSKLLGLNRNTINRYYLIFRELIYHHQCQKFQKEIGGTVEFDESYFGGNRVKGYHGRRKRGRGTLKQPVFGIFERLGRVYTEIVSNCQKQTLQDIIRGKVSKDAIVHTDGWRGYDGLVDVGYDKHFRVNHSKNEFSKGDGMHINGIEAYRSFCKRRLAKFNGVKTNFELHLKECEWRYKRNDLELAKELYNLYIHPKLIK